MNSVSILGLTACIKMNLLKRIDSIVCNNKEEFVKRNYSVFNGLGCFVKNYNFELKKGSLGSVRPARRVPQSLMARLKNELKNMEDRNIIEKVNGASEWVSNLVIGGKKANYDCG